MKYNKSNNAAIVILNNMQLSFIRKNNELHWYMLIVVTLNLKSEYFHVSTVYMSKCTHFIFSSAQNLSLCQRATTRPLAVLRYYTSTFNRFLSNIYTMIIFIIYKCVKKEQ
jgi:hypothetical protein